MYLQSVLVLLMVLSSGVYSYELGDMKPAFVTAVRDTFGSYNGAQVEKLQTSFREAVEAVRQAVRAIEKLKKSPPAPLIHPDRRQT